jgi:hypothetical protein
MDDGPEPEEEPTIRLWFRLRWRHRIPHWVARYSLLEQQLLGGCRSSRSLRFLQHVLRRWVLESHCPLAPLVVALPQIGHRFSARHPTALAAARKEAH